MQKILLLKYKNTEPSVTREDINDSTEQRLARDLNRRSPALRAIIIPLDQRVIFSDNFLLLFIFVTKHESQMGL